jgi:nucleotidyltransferase AbiEii toxin of type IV toxin-antitoxin system
VDPAEEIFANKLCALLGRSEIRDLVDVRALEGLGLSLAEALTAGQRKDGGLTPAQLAWVLSQVTIGDDAKLPGGAPPAELREYLRGLIDRLARLAHP